ncbi:hypothetical protein LBW89_03680 [Paenibacillus sp. alder61]|uniref:hypothetical protein n=1 Tax=Paenibacillus sp. alder61 TaxID=2862948 RepID=UPI001CD5BA7B|nr:hypothetical protein [Paenibacillus sp. alder61]MCA1292117.1 hypothetical protein [Paenibacillus sp. alder61]
MSILPAGVMQGLMRASSSMKMADASMGVYRWAKDSKQYDIMDRAAGYASVSMKEAEAHSEEAGKALEKDQREKRAKEKAEREAALEKHRQEAAAAREAEMRRQNAGKPEAVDNGGTGQAEQSLPGGPSSTEGGMPTGGWTTAPAVQPAAVSTASDVKTYTPQGTVQSVSAEPSISFRV